MLYWVVTSTEVQRSNPGAPEASAECVRGGRPPWAVALERDGFTVSRCGVEERLRDSIRQASGVLLVRPDRSEPCLPESLQRLARIAEMPLILILDAEAPDWAAAARLCGISGYFREPFGAGDLIASVRDCLDRPRSAGALSPSFALRGGECMVGSSPQMNQVRRQIARVAATECNVLITGETGTGKELAADLIYRNSRRSQGPFVCVNCAAIPEMLLESELFGYERGAFTGAHSTRPGQVEMADGGTLFLDEIGEMSLQAQAKILRAIEGKEVARLGRRTGVKVDVRILCATNRDLEEEVRKGTFRADLYFRLNVARLRLPALRERRSDLRELASHYLKAFSGTMGLDVTGFTADSWRHLLAHDWPGNIRELKNTVEASLVQLPYRSMRLAELPEEFRKAEAASSAETSESDQLLAALATHNWNKSKAAQDLRWSRMTLYRKMAQYQLSSGKAKVRTA